MNEAYRRLGHALPERRAGAPAAIASDARSLRGWIDALPMANFATASKRLLEGLRGLNRQRLDGAQRLEALETLRVPGAQLAAATDKQIVGASFPLPAQKTELGELALAFQHELATGYRCALAELCAPAGAVPFLRGRQVALAATRALQHAAAHLAKAYLLYRTPPDGVWQALHDVHAFIASVRLADRDVDDSLQAGGGNARAAYLQALLVALANPYRFTQREQADLVAFARALAPHAQLRTRGVAPDDIPFDELADRGPGYLPEERANVQHDVRALHLDPAFAFVEGQLAMLPPGAHMAVFRVRGDNPVLVDADLVQRILAGWRPRGERVHVRLGGGYVLDSVLGLHDLHFALAGGEDFDSFMRHVRGQVIHLSESDRAAPWRISASEPGRGGHLPARVLDQGLGGYRLLWERGEGGETARARVAELVGLALPERTRDAQPDWMVGVIRWLRIDEQGRVDAGVELLARRALPIGVRVPGDDRRGWMRGLLLAPLNADGGPDYDTLLVSTEIDRTADELELTVPVDLQGPPMPARSECVAGLRLLEASGICRHFALPRAAETPEAGASDRADESMTEALEPGS